MFKVDRVGKRQDSAFLFKDITFAMERGIVAIVGRSGSGKSTLLKCLAHLIPFEEGTVLLDGKSISLLNAEM